MLLNTLSISTSRRRLGRALATATAVAALGALAAAVPPASAGDRPYGATCGHLGVPCVEDDGGSRQERADRRARRACRREVRQARRQHGRTAARTVRRENRACRRAARARART